MRSSVVLASLAVLVPACGNCRKPESQDRPAPAEPAAKAPPADTPGVRFRATVGRARAHEVRAEWAEAVAAYREALAIVPDAPRTLDGLARALLGGGDATAASAAAREAIERAVDVKAMSLAQWTLSQALGQLGDAAGAMRAVRRAHDLLPRAETRTALGTMLGKPPAGYLSPLPVEGPFASLALACEARTPEPAPPGWSCDPDKGTDIGVNKVEPDGGPFAEARIFEAGTPARTDCLLAMRAGTAWWIDELQPGCRGPRTQFASRDLSVVQPQGGGPLHLFFRGEYTARWTEISSEGAETSIEDVDAFVVLCGVGPSRQVSCTPRAPVGSRRTTTRDGSPQASEFKLDLGFGTGGLKLGSGSPETLDRPVRDLLGVHPLDWR